MVGRELPNMRPNGEDHQGVSEDGRRLKMGTKAFGPKVIGWFKNWTAMTRIHKALVWHRVLDGS